MKPRGEIPSNTPLGPTDGAALPSAAAAASVDGRTGARGRGLPRRFSARHVLLKALGRGGTGRVFLALGGGRVCTLKTLRDLGRDVDPSVEEIDPQLLQRFSDEARLVTQLHHPNLLYVSEAGVERGDPFLAMELVRGKSLRQLWARCAEWELPIPIGVSLYLVRELLRGLAYLHDFDDQGLVHRDVSPTTVMLSYEGEVKLGDFGLARWRDRLAETLVSERWEPRPYHSPEQRRGERLDRRSDLYAVGVILWELLTGRALVQAGEPPPLPVPRPSSVVPQVPPDVEAVVMTALAPRREERYESAGAFAAALTRLMSAECDAAKLKGFLAELFDEERESEREEERRLLAAAGALAPYDAPAAGAGTPAAIDIAAGGPGSAGGRHQLRAEKGPAAQGALAGRLLSQLGAAPPRGEPGGPFAAPAAPLAAEVPGSAAGPERTPTPAAGPAPAAHPPQLATAHRTPLPVEPAPLSLAPQTAGQGSRRTKRIAFAVGLTAALGLGIGLRALVEPGAGLETAARGAGEPRRPTAVEGAEPPPPRGGTISARAPAAPARAPAAPAGPPAAPAGGAAPPSGAATTAAGGAAPPSGAATTAAGGEATAARAAATPAHAEEALAGAEEAPGAAEGAPGRADATTPVRAETPRSSAAEATAARARAAPSGLARLPQARAPAATSGAAGTRGPSVGGVASAPARRRKAKANGVPVAGRAAPGGLHDAGESPATREPRARRRARHRAEALLDQAEAFYRRGALATAIARGRAAARAGAGVDAYLLLGKAYFQTERFREAVTAYDEALRLAPHHPSAKRGRAMAASRIQ